MRNLGFSFLLNCMLYPEYSNVVMLCYQALTLTYQTHHPHIFDILIDDNCAC